MKRLILLAGILLILPSIYSQSLRLSAAYFGEMYSHPGLSFSVDKALMQAGKYEVFASGKVGMYVHRRNHVGVFLSAHSGQKITLKSGFFAEQALGLGYLHTFLHGGPTYVVDAFGTIDQVRAAGNSHVMPSVSLGFGWDLAQKDLADVQIFARQILFWQYPFNDRSLFHLAAEVGLSFALNPSSP